MKLLFLAVALMASLQLKSTNGYIIDACRAVKCKNKNEIPCLEVFPDNKETGSYECRCAKTCKTLKYIKGPAGVAKQVARDPSSSQSQKTTTLSTPVLQSQQRLINETSQSIMAPLAIAQEGGSACYPNACMNGGTCFTPSCPGGQCPKTDTSTIPGQPICSCTPQFTGSRCEIYNPSTEGWNNLCRVYDEREMNICQNGGQSVFIADGKVAWVCPSTPVGQYCELPVYNRCGNNPATQCHRDNGICMPDGLCSCRPGYTGAKCDERNNDIVYNPLSHEHSGVINSGGVINDNSQQHHQIQQSQLPKPQSQHLEQRQDNGFSHYDPIQPAYLPPVDQYNDQNTYPNPPVSSQYDHHYSFNQPQREECMNFCHNGGSCQDINQEPFNDCQCQDNWYGNRCESYDPFKHTTIHPPKRCNFTIGLLNDGAFTSRFTVEYEIDGIKQPIITSDPKSFLNQRSTVTIPYYACNVVVRLEVLGFTYNVFGEDRLGQDSLDLTCTKCYKAWNTVTDPLWDYIECVGF